ncbi:hypothetical protein [Gimesia fumaroli]|uniref:Caudovirus prohead protease n=1 Tax=Gimesia fumaroli TaxID=2527976 RepID=A0A518I8W9_9PLAN|nr:hypothetical protein [Gimesia fumaroli]QDV49541.1 hypothetical protein Enr17x_15610 [Gimesia fumaroli]
MPAATVIEDDLDQEAEFVSDLESIQSDMMSHAPELVSPSGHYFQRDQAAVCQASDGGAMTADFVIVTRPNEQNRQGNMLQLTKNKYGNGIVTDYYEQNPVVLYDHGFSGITLPVGLSRNPNGKLALKIQKTKAVATVYFSKLPHAEPIFACVDEGTLRMASIGFNVLKAMLGKQPNKEQLAEGVELWNGWRGYDFVETEMLEWSITPIGADRGALKQALERGKVHDVKLPPFMMQSFKQAIGDERDVWSPGMDFMQLNIGGVVEMKGSHEQISQFLKSDSAEILQNIGKEFSGQRQKPEESVDSDREEVIKPAETQSGKTEEPQLIPVEYLGNHVVQQLNQTKQQQQQVADSLTQSVMKSVNEMLEPIQKGQQQLQQQLKDMTGKVG